MDKKIERRDRDILILDWVKTEGTY